MQVKLKDEQELFELAKELLHIVTNLRFWSDEWNRHHGSVLLGHKKKWEKRADDLIERLKTTRTVNWYDVHIKIENNDTTQTQEQI